jgi:hypothetical protein
MWTLVRMKLRAIRTLLAIPQQPKCLAVWSRGIDPNMGESAIVVVTTTFLKVLTGRRVVGCRVVGKWARITLRTIMLEKPALADSLLVWVMEVTASMSTTYT